MGEILQYRDNIRNLDDRCGRCLVGIELRSPIDPTITTIGTGIVLATVNRSCVIVTSREVLSHQVGLIRFHDGFTKEIESGGVAYINELDLVMFSSKGHDMVHWESVNISENEAIEGQKVFTCGYNSDVPTRRYISGSVVCGAGLENKGGSHFVHGCATGPRGHLGSAVFNEACQFVGLNFDYTRSSGLDYCPDEEKNAPGGLVSSFDLKTIQRGIKSRLPKGNEKTFQEVLQRLEAVFAGVVQS